MKKNKLLSFVLLVLIVMFGTVSYSASKCVHSKWGATSKIEVKATCTRTGISRKRCKNCNEVISEIKIKKLGHSASKTWSSDSTRHYKVCTRCKAQFNISSHSSKWKYTSTTHYQQCSTCKYITSSSAAHKFDNNGKCRCGYIKSSPVIPEPQDTSCKHKFDNYTKIKATCSQEGLTQRICINCGYIISETVVEKLGHNWYITKRDVQKVAKEDRCTSTSEFYKCTRCDASKSNASSDNTHNYRNATCTDPQTCKDCGYINGKELGHNMERKTWDSEVCTRCGEKVTCTSHNWNTRVVTPSTCSTYGIKEKFCQKCGFVVVKMLIPKTVHEYDYEISIKTHTEVCSKCGDKLEAKKHNFVNSICVCGYKENAKIDGCKHEEYTYRETVKATCMTEGEKVGTCVRCGHEVVEKIPSNREHVYSSEAGYNFDSYGHYVHCKLCDAVSPKCEEHTSKAKCTKCGWLCKNHDYIYVSTDKCYECLTCGFRYFTSIATQCKHDNQLKIDRYGHYSICTKCGYKDMYDSNGNVDSKKYGAHIYGKSIDLCNGKHLRKCACCNYELITDHVYSKGVCVSCGSKNTTGIQQKIETKYEFDYTSAEQCKELQEKLEKLGYYNSGIDGVIGKGTVGAINELLKHQGVNIELSLENPKWEYISSEMYTLIMNCTEKQEDAVMRIASESYKNGTATSEEVFMLCQAKLKQLGYYAGEINGDNGEITKNAIITFFELNGIDIADYDLNELSQTVVNQILNSNTKYSEAISKLLEDVLEGKAELNLTSNTTQSKWLQERLSILGYSVGTVDGQLDKTVISEFNKFCQDKGIVGEDGKTLKINGASDWEKVSPEIFKTVMESETYGLEEFVVTDKSLIGVINDYDRYTSVHGFKYDKTRNSGIPPETTTRREKDNTYTTDCSEAVTCIIYLYARENGYTQMADFFGKRGAEDQISSSAKYNEVGSQLKIGKEHEFFELVSFDNAQPGDILVYNGHVEFCADYGVQKGTKPGVWNWGDDSYIANVGVETASRATSKINYILRLK